MLNTDNEQIIDSHQSPINDKILAWVSNKVQADAIEQGDSTIPGGLAKFPADARIVESLFIHPTENTDSSIRFKAKQNWVGSVQKVEDTGIEVRFKDATTGGSDELAELEWDDINPDDRNLVRLGAIVYCSVGRMIRNGQVHNMQVIRLRRLASWTERDVDGIADEAEARMRSMGLE